MFFRQKRVGQYRYLMVVENYRQDGKVRQKTISNLGRLEPLLETGNFANLLRSGLRMLASSGSENDGFWSHAECTAVHKVGPDLLMKPLWQELGIGELITEAGGRKQLDVHLERIVYYAVLHLMFARGNDRGAKHWQVEQRIEGIEYVHFAEIYKALHFLGKRLPGSNAEELGHGQSVYRMDQIENGLFARRKIKTDSVQLVMVDLASAACLEICSESEDPTQAPEDFDSPWHLLAGIFLDSDGQPICSRVLKCRGPRIEAIQSLIEEAHQRFGFRSICIVANSELINSESFHALQLPHVDLSYIIGTPLSWVEPELRHEVSLTSARFTMVPPTTTTPVICKDIRSESGRYLLVNSPEQSWYDRSDREFILRGMKRMIERGLGIDPENSPWRRYIRVDSAGGVEVDHGQVGFERRFDGHWMLRSNRNLSAEQMVLMFSRHWVVKEVFRTTRAIMMARPMLCKREEVMRGHVFCSFLALTLRLEIQNRMANHGNPVRWLDLVRGVNQIQEVTTTVVGHPASFRNQIPESAMLALQACGGELTPLEPCS